MRYETSVLLWTLGACLAAAVVAVGLVGPLWGGLLLIGAAAVIKLGGWWLRRRR